MNVLTQIRRNDQPIYLDYQATTPMDPRVLEAMMPYFTYKFGNPHSRSHSYGWEAEEGVEKARGQVAKLIGADEKEVIFTSGATESNNLAIRGVAEFYKDRKNHIVTTVTEHKCVLDTCRHLEQQGFEVTYLPVQKNGLIDLDVLRAADHRQDRGGLDHGGEQRDRRHPAARRDRQDLPREEGLLPHRRGAGRRQDPARRRGDEHRPDEHLRPQDLRPQGHRRALRAPQAARASGAADRGRRPGARLPLGHPADAALRRPGRSRRDRHEGDGRASPSGSPSCRPAC